MKLKERLPDGGLRLGVLEVLLRDGTLGPRALDPAFDRAAERVRADGDLWTLEDGERQLDLDGGAVDEVLAYAVETLGVVEVPKADLATVRELDFDGGNEIYGLVETKLASRLGLEDWELDTGGETDVFQVLSLAGVEALPKLWLLDLGGHGFCRKERSLAPLAGHPALSKLTLTGSFGDPNVLLELPALERLRTFGGPSLPGSVLKELRERGVDVS